MNTAFAAIYLLSDPAAVGAAVEQYAEAGGFSPAENDPELDIGARLDRLGFIVHSDGKGWTTVYASETVDKLELLSALTATLPGFTAYGVDGYDWVVAVDSRGYREQYGPDGAGSARRTSQALVEAFGARASELPKLSGDRGHEARHRQLLQALGITSPWTNYEMAIAAGVIPTMYSNSWTTNIKKPKPPRAPKAPRSVDF